MERREFEQMLSRLRPLTVQVGYRFFGNRNDAEDVAQDALLRLWTYCEQLDAERNMEALAIMVAKNICVEKYKRKQIGIAEANQDIEAGEGYAADGGIRAQETQMLIDTAIKSLSPRQQQLVRRRYIEDHSAEEIAAETGIPKPSVKSMLSTAKSKLIKILKKQ
ncbi:MAG: sigma-70 family RNA polymerase sigma factor [Prevotellaceae bacterium]|nr:sigma-70 family RNA polymerase sigma factor [Prevotellaceae bacterium]